jgi:lipopolysaccharide export system protein LptA
VLIQGTMELRTSRLVVTQDADGFQTAVATGGANGLARFRQKREGVDEYMEGEAERIEHDARSETPSSSIAPGSATALTRSRDSTFPMMH